MDTANFAGDIRDYAFSSLGRFLTATHLATGDVDRLVNVEILKFDNAEIDLGNGNNAPIADNVAAATDEDSAIGGDLLAGARAFV